MEIDWAAVLGQVLSQDSSIKGTLARDEFPELNEAVARQPPRAVRVAPGGELSLPFETRGVAWFDRGRELVDSEVRPGGFLHHSAGCYYVQDSASLLAIALCQIQPGERVCDLCAAPGGKSTAILEELDGTGVLFCNEVIGSRMGPLTTALARTGYANYLTANQDTERLADAMAGDFDCVLVDAPCSGQSMVARGKQSEASFSEHQIAHSAARQARILRAAAQMVRAGGRLVYSTCTFAYAENEGVVAEFLSQSPEWKLADGPQCLSPYRSSVLDGCYRLWPHRHGCAGGFAATLTRGGSAEVRESGKRRGRSKWTAVKKVPDEMHVWLAENATVLADARRIYNTSERLEYISPDVPDHWIGLAYSAVPLASRKQNRLEPAYALSLLGGGGFQTRHTVELDDQAAIRFVAGEPIRQAMDFDNGSWLCVAWRDRPLAWGKYAGGVLKNHLPKHLRQQVVACLG
ncbi:MAG: SAM-dependent methyltransferase [Aureliella sp.]